MLNTSRSLGPLLLALGLLFQTSCAALSRSTQDEDTRTESESSFVASSFSQETVVILGTNDIHGALAAESFRTKDPEPIPYEKGGASIFGRQYRLLEKEYGSRLLWLDAGDEFQGSIDSNLEEGRPMVEFFNTLDLDAAVIGNHEFDFGPEGAGVDSPALREPGADLRGALKKRISEAKYPYLAANIFEKKTGKPGIPGAKPSVILTAGRLRVGVIGLATQETPTSTRPDYVADLEFRDLAKTAQSEAARLREAGAHVIVVLAHSGLFCNMAERAGKTINAPMIKSPTTLQSACRSNDEIPRMLRSLPPGTVDAVVSGHTHQLVHHWIEGVPVIQGGTRLQYYNLIYLTYDFDKKKVIPTRTRIEGPLPVCPKVFAHQRDCNGDAVAPKKGRGDLVTPRFRDSSVTPDSQVEAALKPYFDKTEAAKKRIVGKVNRKIEHHRTQESPMGNLVADAVRSSVGADAAIINAGGIRSNFETGDLKYEDVFRTLPFDNFVSVLTLKGRELMKFIRIAESGARGYFPVSGLKLKVIDLDQEPWSKDLDGNRKVDPWEMDRIIEATFSDGRPIENEKTYKVATIDFLVQGGDSMGWFMGQIPQERINLIGGPLIRDAVIEHIGKLNSPLNTEAEPLVNPGQPRIVKADRPAKKSAAPKKRAARKKRKR